jgi:hypothetical protein
MAMMEGGISACEFCTFLIAVTFATPHAAIALGHLHPGTNELLQGIFPHGTIESAASEAAAMAPQLCVILGVADAPGHAYFWQKVIYLSTSAAFIAAVIASALSPGKIAGAALPPEASQSFACLWVSISAAISIILSYPSMNQWFTWIGAALVCGFGIFGYPLWKDEVLDWLEPIFVIRSDTHKRRPDQQRQVVRSVSWALGVLCAVTGLWDIILHPPVAQSAEFKLLAQWQAGATPTEADLQLSLANLLNRSSDTLKIETTFADERFAMFAPVDNEPTSKLGLAQAWLGITMDTTGKANMTEKNLEPGFPGIVLLPDCQRLLAEPEEETVAAKERYKLTREQKRAIRVACKWWTDRIPAEEEKPATEALATGGGLAADMLHAW